MKKDHKKIAKIVIAALIMDIIALVKDKENIKNAQ